MRLSPGQLRVRWRILPGLGWTWELATGAEVAVRQSFRGTAENSRPVKAIVVSSQGQEIDFGSLLAKDIKAFLVAAIQDYYGEPPVPAGGFPHLIRSSNGVAGRQASFTSAAWASMAQA